MISTQLECDVRSDRFWLGKVGLAAGAAGGLAEVIWVAVIAPVAGADPVAVARGVSETVLPALAGGTLGVAVGLAIHFVLAIALGLAIAVGVRRVFPRIAGRVAEIAVVMGLLAGVWLVNFAVILPIINPGFVMLLPLWASLISKLMFGLSAALALRVYGAGAAKRA